MARQLRCTYDTPLEIDAAVTLPMADGLGAAADEFEISERALDPAFETSGEIADVGGLGWLLDVYAYADQAGSFDVEISIDGVTWRALSTTAVAAVTLVTLQGVRIPARFVRVTYTNGGVAQTLFEFQVHLRPS